MTNKAGENLVHKSFLKELSILCNNYKTFLWTDGGCEVMRIENFSSENQEIDYELIDNGRYLYVIENFINEGEKNEFNTTAVSEEG